MGRRAWLPAVAVLLVPMQVVAQDCSDPAWQGEPMRRIGVAVSEAALRGSAGQGGTAPGYAASALSVLRAELTRAHLGTDGTGTSACIATLALEDRLADLRLIAGAPPAPLDGDWTGATCDDPARAGDLWATMLPDIARAKADGILSEETYRGFSVAFTSVYARVSGMDAAPLPEVCRAFLGLWLIWRS